MTFKKFLLDLKNKKLISYTDIQFKMISIKWIIGGKTGGNCWGGEPYSINTESEPEFDQFDKILENYFPDISFISYKKFMKNLNFSNYTNDEYYGNYCDFKIKSFNLIDIYNFLIENGKI